MENILASYGLYYQWGRKDPFIGPSSYNAANGASASMYNGGGSRVYLRTAASSAETGTVAYAVQHPLTFITGVSGSENDWLWSAHSDDLWSASEKSAYDPCPYGWRVAPSAVFDGLKLVGAPTAADADKYGWGLTDPERGTSSLFIGAGRRRYDNSTILNVYNPVTVRSVAEEAQPGRAFIGPQGRCRVRNPRLSTSGSRRRPPAEASKTTSPMPVPTACRCVA